jgi:hypothetical protein
MELNQGLSNQNLVSKGCDSNENLIFREFEGDQSIERMTSTAAWGFAEREERQISDLCSEWLASYASDLPLLESSTAS